MKVLLVDDRRENLLALESLLKQPGVEHHRANSGIEALELLLVHDFALALIDVQMPGMDGLELAELMRGTNETRSVPIIFVTAGARDQIGTFKGYEKGAVDYLYKPLDPIVVKSKVNVFLELARQRQALEAQLQDTRRALEARDFALTEAHEALRTRDEFMSIASHELKTPLTSLYLQLQLITRNLTKNSASNAFKTAAEQVGLGRISNSINTCERQAAKLATLLDELLDLTRIRLGRLLLTRESVDLAKVAQEIATQFRAEASSSNYVIELSANTPVVGDWDPTRIEQVVRNLVSNAVKYGEGRPISIEVECDPHTSRARLVVKDHGMGIPLEMQGKIFKRFERAVGGDKISGLGLGLYISRQIVEAHGGWIKVSSALGRGSVFTVELPLTAVGAPPARAS